MQLLLCARDEARVVEVARTISASYGIMAVGMQADVSKSEDIDRVLKSDEKSLDGAYILINNAGTGRNETILDASDDKSQYYWDLHVMAAVQLSRGLVPVMVKWGGGIIIQNASVNVKQPWEYEPIFNVTKAALVMFSKCLSNELIGRNIRVNCINPGLILTP